MPQNDQVLKLANIVHAYTGINWALEYCCLVSSPFSLVSVTTVKVVTEQHLLQLQVCTIDLHVFIHYNCGI